MGDPDTSKLKASMYAFTSTNVDHIVGDTDALTAKWQTYAFLNFSIGLVSKEAIVKAYDIAPNKNILASSLVSKIVDKPDVLISHMHFNAKTDFSPVKVDDSKDTLNFRVILKMNTPQSSIKNISII